MAAHYKMIVNVPLATVWTSYESPRTIDEAAISNPVKIDSWLSRLTYETCLELCNANLVQSQVLFGQEVIITAEKNGWVQIVVPEQPSGKDKRGYPGWLPKVQLAANDDWNIKQGKVTTVNSKKAMLYSESDKILFELSYQTTLPVLEEQSDRVKVKLPTGTGFLMRQDVAVFSSYYGRAKGNGKDIISAGEKFLGLPYVWGGMSSYGFDCSGFSYMMYRANGYIIPRDAGDQAEAGFRVEPDAKQPGDLLFFAHEEGKGNIHHVGIYYGDGKLLHSPKTGKNIEILPLAGTIYEKELCAASRYWRETEE
ncbi:NlpC/P60 family protein [Peribacillus cavernae]|uniref:NlpC/P60 family protein n=1 Tax=Peribacillus cavernae TaxID=1674310 RepID=A0A3S0U4Z9_9BACI|nr:C40 family peptidase [Peribacillus cavernae]MDQ0217366.1 cell wall-associated NlpC family hydrolase [Peribacillus cavernae]RUQ30184.1 NlpC/P60 family protein [Peribacillus cavernae]